MNIQYLFFSFWLSSLCMTVFRSLYISTNYPVLFLFTAEAESNIPSCIRTTSLSIPLLLVVSVAWFLWIVLLWSLGCMCLFKLQFRKTLLKKVHRTEGQTLRGHWTWERKMLRWKSGSDGVSPDNLHGGQRPALPIQDRQKVTGPDLSPCGGTPHPCSVGGKVTAPLRASLLISGFW